MNEHQAAAGRGRADLLRLSFVRRARELGPIEHVRVLLDLADQRERDRRKVDAFTREHLDAVDRRIADLAPLRHELGSMLSACHGASWPTAASWKR